MVDSKKSGFVAIVGRPNSGKSTLLNHILGSKISIVTPKAQTTREKTLGILNDPQGQIVFIDTPGVHRARPGGINQFMVDQAREALHGPSLVWYIVDPFSGLIHEREVIDLIREASSAPVFLLLNKADYRTNEGLRGELENALREQGACLEKTFPISAQTGQGLKELLEETWGRMESGPLYYPDTDQLSDRPMRFFVAEKVREQLLLHLGEELPYSCAVQIEKFDESGRLPRIEAMIFVERESQLGMVVGKGGQKIKEIGQAARQEIEEFMGAKVFLGLRVKLLKDWTRDAQALKRMGYHLPQPRRKPLKGGKK